MTAIVIENLVKTYGTVRALDGLNLNVPTGSIFGFLGPNGAGKTTTLRILAGLAKPNSGKVTIAGVELNNTAPRPSEKVGYLPEEPAFYGWMTPVEFLTYAGRIFELDKQALIKKITELLDLVGLSEVKKRKIGGFSRGMRQRMGIAQALVNTPEILLLDEPVSALDPSGRKDILELIETLAQHCTVVMSSHILADVERVCDTIAIIDKGKTLVQERKDALMGRYAGNILELEIDPRAGRSIDNWKQVIFDLPGVYKGTTEGYTLRLAVEDIDLAQQSILAQLTKDKVSIIRFEQVKPSLEDVFMKLVNGSKEAE
jgi:ABC-2 type transport system ATP-binding protein